MGCSTGRPGLEQAIRALEMNSQNNFIRHFHYNKSCFEEVGSSKMDYLVHRGYSIGFFINEDLHLLKLISLIC